MAIVVWQSRFFVLLAFAALVAVAAASCRDIDEPPPVIPEDAPDGGSDDASVDGAIS